MLRKKRYFKPRLNKGWNVIVGLSASVLFGLLFNLGGTNLALAAACGDTFGQIGIAVDDFEDCSNRSNAEKIQQLQTMKPATEADILSRAKQNCPQECPPSLGPIEYSGSCTLDNQRYRVTGSTDATCDNDNKPPDCATPNIISPQMIEIPVQDAGSGLAGIEAVIETNVLVRIPDFIVGTNNPVIVTVERKDQSKSAQVVLQVTDVAGNSNDQCDPVTTLVVREKGKPASETFSSIPQEESKVTVINGKPGITNLEVIVNGKKFKVTALGDDAKKILDVSSAMIAGNNNTFVLTAKGKPGATATVVISN